MLKYSRAMLASAILLLCSCGQKNGYEFSTCENISEAFVKEFPDFGGCSVSEGELNSYFDKASIKYRIHENKDGSMSHLIEYGSQQFNFTKDRISRMYVVQGPFSEFPKRKENYAIFVAEGGEVLAILPRYASFGP